MTEFPAPGDVFDDHYLWKWQAQAGETEGRKSRPSCVAIVVQNAGGETVMFIAPISSQSPTAGRLALRVPETEAHRANIDTTAPLWVMVDELNVDILEKSYTLESRDPRGEFSPAFTIKIVRAVQAVRKTGRLDLTDRVDWHPRDAGAPSV